MMFVRLFILLPFAFCLLLSTVSYLFEFGFLDGQEIKGGQNMGRGSAAGSDGPSSGE